METHPPALDGLAVCAVGCDLLRIARVAAVYERLGDRFVQRILTPAEQQLWLERGATSNFLAKQFAAKEALAKALGTGIAKGIGFQQLQILRDEQGAPSVTLLGVAAQRLQQLGASRALLSLSDDDGLVQAFVVLAA
ncbi:MAG: holo-ACP synthase [Bacterioplanes sp.]|nr:holo-ACP synthase [Bacterioplanes sp.]